MIVGIGVDLVDLERIRRMIERYEDRFLDRILTAGEKAYCARHRDRTPPVAARFAAKEAVLKALGTGLDHGIRWCDVEVVRGTSGPPRIELHAAAAAHAKGMSIDHVHISLTHDRGAAVAMVVLERQS